MKPRLLFASIIIFLIALVCEAAFEAHYPHPSPTKPVVCTPYSHQAMEADWTAAQQRWNQAGSPTDYAITVRWAEVDETDYVMGIGDVRITYRSNRAVSAISLKNGGDWLANHDPVDEIYFKGFDGRGVAQTLSYAQYLIRDPNQPPCYVTLEISYDPVYGYVTKLIWDKHGLLNPLPTCVPNPYWSFKGCLPASEFKYYKYWARDLSIPGITTTPTTPLGYPAPILSPATPVAYPP